MMSSLVSFLSSVSVILLLTAVCEAHYDDYTPAPDYSDYNATFEYSFYSNASSEDLDEFSELFIDQEEEEVTATMATTTATTEQGGVKVHNAASLPVSLEIGTLLWILMILNASQIQHTL